MILVLVLMMHTGYPVVDLVCPVSFSFRLNPIHRHDFAIVRVLTLPTGDFRVTVFSF